MVVTLTERAILDVLSFHHWKTGLEIVDQGGGARGTIYVHLFRLEEMGLIERRCRKGESRFEYKLTESGMRRRSEQSGTNFLQKVLVPES